MIWLLILFMDLLFLLEVMVDILFGIYSKKVKYMKLRFLKEFPKDTFKYESLKSHGLGQVQIQARLDYELRAYVENVENKITP